MSLSRFEDSVFAFTAISFNQGYCIHAFGFNINVKFLEAPSANLLS